MLDRASRDHHGGHGHEQRITAPYQAFEQSVRFHSRWITPAKTTTEATGTDGGSQHPYRPSSHPTISRTLDHADQDARPTSTRTNVRATDSTPDHGTKTTTEGT